MNLIFENIKKIGVLSDTHIPKRAEKLPESVLKHLKDVDLILHAGDIVTIGVLEELKMINKNVIAVHGNMDYNLSSQLPSKLILQINNFKIGLTHGSGPKENIRSRIIDLFQEKLDCIVYGHTHEPFNEIENEILFFNPGSPTDKIFAPINTIGILNINDKIKGELIKIR